MSAQQQKNYLFISNHCEHSKRLMIQLQKTQLMNSFQLVNIDDPRVQLPQFVQCVPTLYIPSKRHVLTDADLFQWFQNEFDNENKNVGKINMVDITGDSNILPFLTSEMGSGLSGASYSFLEDEKNELMNQNYSFLQERDINKMPDFTRHDAPSSFNSNSNKGAGIQQKKTGGTTDQAYDMMMKARGTEMQNRAPPQTPNFSSPY
jgi:hypothetical protein